MSYLTGVLYNLWGKPGSSTEITRPWMKCFEVRWDGLG